MQEVGVMRILTFNIRSIRIRVIVNAHLQSAKNSQIVCFTETWPNEKEIKLQNRYGLVAAYYRTENRRGSAAVF